LNKRGCCLVRRMSQDMILIEKGKLIRFVKDLVERNSQCCIDQMCCQHYITHKEEMEDREYYNTLLEDFGLSLEDFEFDERGYFIED